MKMELTEGSETSAYINQTPGNYPKGNVLYSVHGESLKSRIPQMVTLFVAGQCPKYYQLQQPYTKTCGPGSSLGMATEYGLDDPGSNPGGDVIFRPSRPALEPAQLPVQWVPGLSRG